MPLERLFQDLSHGELHEFGMSLDEPTLFLATIQHSGKLINHTQVRARMASSSVLH